MADVVRVHTVVTVVATVDPAVIVVVTVVDVAGMATAAATVVDVAVTATVTAGHVVIVRTAIVAATVRKATVRKATVLRAMSVHAAKRQTIPSLRATWTSKRKPTLAHRIIRIRTAKPLLTRGFVVRGDCSITSAVWTDVTRRP